MMKSHGHEFHKGRSYLNRPLDKKEINQRFLITCEGEKTEPNYFDKFRTNKVILKIKGCGYNTLKLVEETITLKNDDDYDQVWCVFDKDSFPTENVEKAISMARKNGIKTAFSNESFELWYLLHFDYLTAALSRKDYINPLSDKFKFKYEKNDETMYERLLSRQQTAITNAQRLLTEYKSYNPDKNNPSTTIHKLVQVLNKYRFD
jgi:hypothetical protein